MLLEREEWAWQSTCGRRPWSHGKILGTADSRWKNGHGNPPMADDPGAVAKYLGQEARKKVRTCRWPTHKLHRTCTQRHAYVCHRDHQKLKDRVQWRSRPHAESPRRVQWRPRPHAESPRRVQWRPLPHAESPRRSVPARTLHPTPPYPLASLPTASVSIQHNHLVGFQR